MLTSGWHSSYCVLQTCPSDRAWICHLVIVHSQMVALAVHACNANYIPCDTFNVRVCTVLQCTCRPASPDCLWPSYIVELVALCSVVLAATAITNKGPFMAMIVLIADGTI